MLSQYILPHLSMITIQRLRRVMIEIPAVQLWHLVSKHVMNHSVYKNVQTMLIFLFCKTRPQNRKLLNATWKQIALMHCGIIWPLLVLTYLTDSVRMLTFWMCSCLILTWTTNLLYTRQPRLYCSRLTVGLKVAISWPSVSISCKYHTYQLTIHTKNTRIYYRNGWKVEH